MRPQTRICFEYDSNYGRFNGTVTVDGNDLIINGDRLKVFAQRDPAADSVGRRWRGHCDRVDRFFHRCRQGPRAYDSWRQEGHYQRARQERRYHDCDGCQRRASLTRPSTTSSPMPAAPPMAWRQWPKCCMSALASRRACSPPIHAYTNSQRLLDVAAPDLRDARAAAHEHCAQRHRRCPRRGSGDPGAAGQVHWHGFSRANLDRFGGGFHRHC